MSLEIGTRLLAIGGDWVIPKLAKEGATEQLGSHLVNLGFPTVQRLVQPPDGARVSSGCRDERVSLMTHGELADSGLLSADIFIVVLPLRACVHEPGINRKRHPVKMAGAGIVEGDRQRGAIKTHRADRR